MICAKAARHNPIVMQGERESILILGDQLLPQHPMLQAAEKSRCVVIMIEARDWIAARRDHKQKAVLLLSAMRHYAASLRAQGWTVDYRVAETLVAGLREHLRTFQSVRLCAMEAAEWEVRQQQHALRHALKIEVNLQRNAHFLCEQFTPVEKPGKKLILEYFYREMRRHFGVLMTPQGDPVGGVWNLDHQNRNPYDGKVAPPPPLSFPPDEITRDVMHIVERDYPEKIGSTANFTLAVTREQALKTLADFIKHRLPHFGVYEDAMSTREPILFHSVLSPLMNIGLLEPLEVVCQAEAAYYAGQAPLNSVEGFIRQVMGWREYVYWRYHKMMPGFHERNHWQAERALPEFFWTGNTAMNCLQQVIQRVLATGYSHHIERLMVLCNFALLAGIHPRAVNDWFLNCYVDAYDWVVTPNVIGMGLCADGGVVGTKPYIASAAYINKMSDYCGACRFNPKTRTGEEACPYNFLYWNFLLRFEPQLRANPRMGPNVLGLKHLNDEERQRVRAQAEQFLQTMSERYLHVSNN